MNILVTGASGLIGAALVNRLRGEGNSIFCQSRFDKKQEHDIKWLKHDLVNDSWQDLLLPDIDVIYHLAGQTSTNFARQKPLADLNANVLTLLNMMEYFKYQVHPPFIVLAGTATEVGLTNILPINEKVPDRPITFYDLSKLTAEKYLMLYVNEKKLNGCCLRFPNVFGHMRGSEMSDRGIIDKVYWQAISGNNINIYGDGNFIRDYLFIDDVVSALISASNCIDNTNGRMFCIGTGHGVTLKNAFSKVIDAAAFVTGKKVNLISIEPPADLSEIEFRNAIIDSSEFTMATGWLPKYDFHQAIDSFYYDLNTGLKQDEKRRNN